MRPLARLFPFLFLVFTGCEKLKQMKFGKPGADKASAVEGHAAKAVSGPLVREVDEAEFDAFIAIPDRVVMVDFTATWCGPCRMLAPRLEALVNAHGGRVLLGKVDVDRNRGVSQRMGVSGIPDVRIYVNGAEVSRFVGGLDERGIEAKLAPALAKVPKAIPATAGSSGEKRAAAAQPTIQPMKEDWMPEGMERR